MLERCIFTVADRCCDVIGKVKMCVVFREETKLEFIGKYGHLKSLCVYWSVTGNIQEMYS